MFADEPRFRIHARQTASNKWYLDGTVEYKDEYIDISTDPNDVSKAVNTSLGLRLLSLIRETEKQFRKDGRLLVSDK